MATRNNNKRSTYKDPRPVAKIEDCKDEVSGKDVLDLKPLPLQKEDKAILSLEKSASVPVRERKSMFDPDMLKRLKTLNIDALKPDEQIELAILILQKESEGRSTIDINFLMRCTENVQFFKTYDQDTHRLCMQKMYHVHLQKGDSCMQFGEVGDTFWVTLKGSVGVVVPIDKEVADKNGEVRMQKVMTEVATRGAGSSFGELALVERRPRAATIYCKEACEFAVLSKDFFKQILLEKENQRIFVQVNFLQAMEIFSHWTYAAIKKLYLLSVRREFQRGHVVYNQYDLAKHMYIIKYGEFKVSFQAKYEKDDLNEDDNVQTKTRYLRQKPSRHVELAILGQPEMFGVEELIANKPRMHTVTCISQTAIALEIKHEDMNSTILKDPGARKWLHDYLSSKSDLHKSFIHTMYSSTKDVKNFLMLTQSSLKNKSRENSPAKNLMVDYAVDYDHVAEFPNSIKISQKNLVQLHMYKDRSLSPKTTHRNQLVELSGNDMPPRRLPQMQAWTYALKSNNTDESRRVQQSPPPILKKNPDGRVVKLSVTEQVFKERNKKSHLMRKRSPDTDNRNRQALQTQQSPFNNARDSLVKPLDLHRKSSNSFTVADSFLKTDTPRNEDNCVLSTEETTSRLNKDTPDVQNIHHKVSSAGHGSQISNTSTTNSDRKEMRPTLKKNRHTKSEFKIPFTEFDTNYSDLQKSEEFRTISAADYYNQMQQKSRSPIRVISHLSKFSSSPFLKNEEKEVKFTCEKVVLNKLIESESRFDYQSFSKLTKESLKALKFPSQIRSKQLLYNTTIAWSALPNQDQLEEKIQQTVNIHIHKKKQQDGTYRASSNERVRTKSPRYFDRKRFRLDSNNRTCETLTDGFNNQQTFQLPDLATLMEHRTYSQNSAAIPQDSCPPKFLEDSFKGHRSVQNKTSMNFERARVFSCKNNHTTLVEKPRPTKVLPSFGQSSPLRGFAKINLNIPKLSFTLSSTDRLPETSISQWQTALDTTETEIKSPPKDAIHVS